MLNRPQALEHNEKKPSNAAAGPSALRTGPAWQSQAQGEERGHRARGQRGKLQTPGVHASLHSGCVPNPPWSPTALQAHPPLGGGRSLHTLFPSHWGTRPCSRFPLLPLPNKDHRRTRVTKRSPAHTRPHATSISLLTMAPPARSSLSTPSLSQTHQASTPFLTKTVASLTSYNSNGLSYFPIYT